MHFHPFFPSCGQRSPNVAFLASTIRVLIGFSRCISPTRASIHDVTAHPQPGDSFRCSSSGLSPFSHPHIDSRQRKHFTLSGFSWDGRKKNPAAASCGALEINQTVEKCLIIPVLGRAMSAAISWTLGRVLSHWTLVVSAMAGLCETTPAVQLPYNTDPVRRPPLFSEVTVHCRKMCMCWSCFAVLAVWRFDVGHAASRTIQV